MDQRRYPRIEVHYPGSFRGEGVAGHGQVLNLSWGGCAFKSDRKLQVGDFLQVDLHLAHEPNPVKVDIAIVRWAREQMFGIDFIQVGPDEQTRLRRFVRTPKLVRWLKNKISGGPQPRPF